MMRSIGLFTFALGALLLWGCDSHSPPEATSEINLIENAPRVPDGADMSLSDAPVPALEGGGAVAALSNPAPYALSITSPSNGQVFTLGIGEDEIDISLVTSPDFIDARNGDAPDFSGLPVGVYLLKQTVLLGSSQDVQRVDGFFWNGSAASFNASASFTSPGSRCRLFPAVCTLERGQTIIRVDYEIFDIRSRSVRSGSANASVTIQANASDPPISVPFVTSTYDSNRFIQLSWAPVPGAVSYTIMRTNTGHRGTLADGFTDLGTATTVTDYPYSAPDFDTFVRNALLGFACYRVTAVSASGRMATGSNVCYGVSGNGGFF